MSGKIEGKGKRRITAGLIILIIAGACVVLGSYYGFKNVESFRNLFAAPGTDVYGNVTEGSEAALMHRNEFAAKVSMWIFAFITVLQMIALWVGYTVIAAIRHSSDPVKLKLKNLENSEIFFDTPRDFGLFGTVPAFLVMTFSPQSSRLIAYSSTLIGILFSLFLRLTLQFPLRRKLMREDFETSGGSEEK